MERERSAKQADAPRWRKIHQAPSFERSKTTSVVTEKVSGDGKSHGSFDDLVIVDWLPRCSSFVVANRARES